MALLRDSVSDGGVNVVAVIPGLLRALVNTDCPPPLLLTPPPEKQVSYNDASYM